MGKIQRNNNLFRNDAESYGFFFACFTLDPMALNDEETMNKSNEHVSSDTQQESEIVIDMEFYASEG